MHSEACPGNVKRVGEGDGYSACACACHEVGSGGHIFVSWCEDLLQKIKRCKLDRCVREHSHYR